MFTGLIQAVGTILEVGSDRLHIDASGLISESDPIAIGESIAIDGCCLTALNTESPLKFELSPETWKRTAFFQKRPGDLVNLERAMRASDRFGGHIVQGHVDAVGKLVTSIPHADHHEVTFEVAPEWARYLIDKGSVAINGISLTVVEPAEGKFATWIIPHTLSHTNLSSLRPGADVNFEFDVIAKYVEGLARK